MKTMILITTLLFLGCTVVKESEIDSDGKIRGDNLLRFLDDNEKGVRCYYVYSGTANLSCVKVKP